MNRFALALTLGAGLATAVPAAPALADGAASTRNIIFGAAAAGAATYLIVHHNAQVHQKYAEYDRRQAQTAAERNDAQAAYYAQRQAYEHEAAVVAAQNREIAYQHKVVLQLRHQLAMRSGGSRHNTNVAHRPAPAAVQRGRVATRRESTSAAHVDLAQNSIGWGNL